MIPSCRDVVDQASDYLAGDLPWWRRALLVFHVGFCVHCLNFVRQLRATVGVLERVGPDPAPEATRAELLRAFREGAPPEPDAP